MNRTGDKSKGKDALLALLLNAAVLAVLLLVFRPFFETNDDTALLTLVNGAKYSADPHMVISGIWMGRLLMALYSLTHALPWYTLVQITMLFLSFTGVTYVLIRRLGRLWGLVLSFLLVGWFGYSSYIVIQFSRTAGIAAASSMFLLFHAVAGLFPELSGKAAAAGAEPVEIKPEKTNPGKTGAEEEAEEEKKAAATNGQEKRKTTGIATAEFWLCLVLALVLSVLSSWLRFTQFLPCAALTTGIGLWMLLTLIPASLRKDCVKKLAVLLLPFAAVLCICLVFRIDDKRSYRQGDVWEDFRQFDLRREELYDYGFPDYPTNVETYRSVGISDAGYTLYRNWNFADPDRFTVEAMDALIAVKEDRHFGWQMVKDFFKEVPLKLLQKPYIWFLLFTLIAFFASGMRDRSAAAARSGQEGQKRPNRQKGRVGRKKRADWCKRLIAVLWGLLLFGVLYLYLYYQGRYLRNRVDTALVYALILSILWFVRPVGVKRTWWIVPVLVVCMVLVPGMKQNFRLRQAGAKRLARMEKRRGLLENLSADSEHLYVMKMGSLVANDCYGPLDVMPEKVIGNLLYLGGWATYTKAFMDTMEAYGITNPYRDLIDNDRLYLVDDDIELTMTYLRENYAPDARYEQVGELQKFGIYRVYSQ